MIEIPFKQFTSFIEEVTLDLVPYRFIFNWNYRGSFWTLSIENRDKVPLISGVKLVINFELIFDFPDKGLPPGQIYVIDESENNDRIQRDDFTTDRLLKLVYLTESEI